MFLCGTHSSTLDAKNRIRLPAKLKAELGDKYILLPGMDGCIYVIKEDEPQAIIDIISKNQSVDPNKENILRTIVSLGSNVEADAQGRFTLPGNLIEYASIGEAVVIVGNIDKVEIWSGSAWSSKKMDLSPNGINNMYSALSNSNNT